MMHTNIFLFFSVLLCFAFMEGSAFSSEMTTDSLLIELDNELSKRKEYQANKEQEITELKAKFGKRKYNPKQAFELNMRLINAFEAFRFDSSMFYIRQNIRIARQLKKSELLNRMLLVLAGRLTTSGQQKEALDILKKIHVEGLLPSFKSQYFSRQHDIYSFLCTYAQSNENIIHYRQQRDSYADSLLSILKPSSSSYLAIKEKVLLDKRDLMACREVNSKRMASCKTGTREYSIVCFIRALTFFFEGNERKQKEFLVRSAISDIRASIKDNAALAALAVLVFNDDDVQRAHRYINIALEDATHYNSHLRFIEVSHILPVITKAYEIETEKQKSRLQNTIMLVSALLGGLLIAFVFIFWQIRKVSSARNELTTVNGQLKKLNEDLNAANTKLNFLNTELADSNLVKEHYIGNFLDICSNYIEKLDDNRKKTGKLLMAGKADELLRYTKSDSWINDELKEFYRTFDITFLNIYPNFVARLNEMLDEQQPILLKEGEALNTELRIFALIRLGISDSSKIAQLLRYSVNTIYNYRAKVKNRAIVSRDEFDDLVMRIRS